jgi:hypothetical protein
MIQPDLFTPPVKKCCGTCVVLMHHHDEPGFGACSRFGKRSIDDAPCRNWFGTDEARKPLYGRRVKR